jgi:hypothetical protein
MTLLLPNLSCFIIKTSLTGIFFFDQAIKYWEQEFPIELFGWLQYIFIPYIAAVLLIGLPILVLEISLGQYYETGGEYDV